MLLASIAGIAWTWPKATGDAAAVDPAYPRTSSPTPDGSGG